MNTYEEMLDTWQRSASVMHIAHHAAAALYAKRQRMWGVTNAVLSAVVTSSLFVTISEQGDDRMLLITGVISMLAAMVAGVNAALDFGTKAQHHYVAATAFQALRREIEEALVRCRVENVTENYQQIRDKWSVALEGAIPLPPRIHETVKADIDTKHRE